MATVVIVKGIIRNLDPDSSTIALATEVGRVLLLVTHETEVFKDGEESRFAQLEVEDIVWQIRTPAPFDVARLWL